MTQEATAPQAAAASAPATPIADLSYRNYDGPLHTRAARWWVISTATIRLTARKKEYWIVLALSALPYLFSAAMLFIFSQFGNGNQPNPFLDLTPGQKYAALFHQALGWQCIWLLIVALIVGAGSISADNQSNALMVYLAKPITKSDYLIGKWVGVFLMIWLAALAPAMLLYLYCVLSYTSVGFLRQEPWLILRILAASAIPGMMHASLLTGISAWSRTPRMAGAAYAGLYFAATIAAQMYWGFRYRGDGAAGFLERHLSIDGSIRALAQWVFGLTIHRWQFHHWRGPELLTLAVPNPRVILPLTLGLMAVGIIAARARIRAVEVVKG